METVTEGMKKALSEDNASPVINHLRDFLIPIKIKAYGVGILDFLVDMANFSIKN